jgi:hypothetical protein
VIKRLERLKNAVNKYMADLPPDRLTTYQSERKLVVSRRPGVFIIISKGYIIFQTTLFNTFLTVCTTKLKKMANSISLLDDVYHFFADGLIW